MRVKVVVVVLLSLVVGCVQPNDRVCGIDRNCPNPDRPFCDLGGDFGPPGTCIPIDCIPGTFQKCGVENAASVSWVCNADGTNLDGVMCGAPLTCSEAVMGCRTCAPDALACSDDGAAVVKCNADGIEVLDHTCATGCLDGACKACSEGTLACDANNQNLDKCDAAGAPQPFQTCPAGCGTGGGDAHCLYLQPQYVPDACDAPATTDLTVTTAMVLDTSDSATCTGGTIAQSAPDRPVCVVRYRKITIAAGGSIAVKSGATAPSLALVADELVDVSGTIDISAVGSAPGAGAEPVTTGQGTGYIPLGNMPTQVTGSGAGGWNAGAKGCSITAGTLVDGGSAQTHPVNQTSLHGGTSGGGSGGAGGGAITVIACRGAVNVSGTIVAGGGGGQGGHQVIDPELHTPTGTVVASGGGAGGTIILQGLSVSVTGSLFAHGGGGGGGFAGNPGTDGGSMQFAPPGGTSSGSGGNVGKQGGSGGWGSAMPQMAQGCGAASTNPSAGGGSQGFLGYVTPNMTAALAPAFTSPSGMRPIDNTPAVTPKAATLK